MTTKPLFPLGFRAESSSKTIHSKFPKTLNPPTSHMTSHMNTPIRTIFCFFFLALALASTAFGQNATWTSSSNQTWSLGSNWSNAAGPGINATDRATFNSANGTANPNLTANATTGAIAWALTDASAAPVGLQPLGSGAVNFCVQVLQ